MVVAVGFAAADWRQGRPLEGWMTFGVGAFLGVTLVLLPFWARVWHLFRAALGCAVLQILFHIATGKSEGIAFLWLYTLPVMAFFLFGIREGIAWVLTSSVLVVGLFFGDLGSHPYPTSVGARFLITYGIVSLLAYSLEANRLRQYRALLAEKTSLEGVLAQIETLRGLLPICAVCKRVRDDRGSWNQIETYIRQHSRAEFQHSRCPDCRGNAAALAPSRAVDGHVDT